MPQLSRPYVVALLAAAAILACSPPPPAPQPNPDRWTELCGQVSCGAGRCVVDQDAARCLCDEGFAPEALTCLPTAPTNPCSPNPCVDPGRTRCEAEGPVARCLCDEDRVEIDQICVPKTACTPNPCTQPFRSQCVLKDGDAVCQCDPGHAPTRDGCDPVPTFDCDVVHANPEADDFEPNECPALATELRTDAMAPQQHSINPTGDVDYFVIETQAAHVYEVKATSSGLALYGDAYTSDGLTPIGADHGGGTTALVRFKGGSPGPSYVRIRALRADEVGSYSISAKHLGVDDFPDTTATALGITSDASFNGAIQFAGDVDAFQVPVDAFVSYSFGVEAIGPTGNLRLELIAADGTTVQRVGIGSTVELITRPGSPGSIFLRVSAFAPTVVNGYKLTARVLGPDDHADVVEEATLVGAGPLPISVVSERSGDVDVLTFDAVAAHIYAVKCKPAGSPTGAAAYAVLDPNGNVLGQAGTSYTGPLTFDAAQTGKHFVRVTHSAVFAGPRSFACELEDLGVDDHGDDLANATPIAVNAAPAVGMMETSTDLDVFSFTGQANHVYRFNCAMSFGAGCTLRMLGSGGATIVTGWSALAYKVPSNGTYYLEVSPYISTVGSYTYSLEDLGLDDHGDDVASASALSSFGQVNGASFESAQDKDAISFTATGQHIYRITCTTQGSFGCAIKLLDSAGVPVQSSGASPSSGTTQLAREMLGGGTYYVLFNAVTSNGGSGPYTWTVEDLGIDDHGDDAATASIVATGDSGSANLEYSGDIDAFRLTPVAHHVYRFSCSRGTAPSCDLRVRDASGALLATTASSSASTSISWEAPSSAPITFTVGDGTSQKPQGTYGWTVTDVGLDDHGDTYAASTPVALPMPPTSAELEAFGDVDVFSYPVIAGRVYRFTCTRISSPGCGVRARDASGATLASAVTTSSGSAVVAFLAAVSAPLYFEVYDGAFPAPAGTGSYTWILEDLGVDDHGGSPSTATPISLGLPGLAGNIQFANDSDVFSFSATAGRIYNAYCNSSSSMAGGCRLTFTSSSGVTLVTNTGQVAWEAAQTETLYVEVKGYFTSSTGTYSLNVEDGGTDDHGDTHQAATPLSPGASMGGSLEYAGDLDYFSISLASNTQYAVSLLGGSTMDVTVYAADGVTVVASGGQFFTFTSTSSGTYYLKVRFSFASANSANYSVEVQ